MYHVCVFACLRINGVADLVVSHILLLPLVMLVPSRPGKMRHGILVKEAGEDDHDGDGYGDQDSLSR